MILRKRLPFLPFLLLMVVNLAAAAEIPARFTVALDGSGDFRSIQDAINAVDPDNRERVIIYLDRWHRIHYPAGDQRHCGQRGIFPDHDRGDHNYW